MDIVRSARALGAARDDWRIDVVLAGLAMLLGLLPYVILDYVFDRANTDLPAAVITSGIAFAAIAIRRTYPLAFMAIAAAALLVQVLLVPTPTVGILVVPFASYSVARWVPGLWARSVLVVGAVGSVLGPLRWIGRPYGVSDVAVIVSTLLATGVCAGLVITPYAIGRRVRDMAHSREALALAEAERFRILVSEREHEARAIEARTRNQIARELHDVVAHSLSVMVVQAEGGYAVAAKKPEAAAAALGTIAATGRDALGEMRRIVAVLREGDAEAESYAPLPSVGDIPRLVEKSGATLTVIGTPPAVQPALGLTAYRIVQEALTNVLKHAGVAADPRVRVTYDVGGIALEIVDSGLGARAVGDGRGHGLRGMAERVTAHGGTLEAGPLPEAGYRVRAWLPVSAPESGRIDA